MAFCELRFFSKALEKATRANIVLPENKGSGPFPVLYLLHGLSDDQSGWMRWTSIERYVRELPLIVVMPDGGRGFYCDAEQGFAYESALVRDLIGYVDDMFPTKRSREGRVAAGLSMGGYGAAKLALKFPDLFCGAVSHSGAMCFAHRTMPADSENSFHREFGRVVGENPIGGPNDLFALAEHLDPAHRPALRVDCGTEDFLLDDNRAFHAHLEHLGFPHEYHEFPGAHNWQYWDEHVQGAINFLCSALGVHS